MRGVPLTPEQRAERNAARRALARRVARRSAAGTLALIVMLVLFAWWLLTTFGGRDFLLAQIVARLPAGTALTWQSAEGPASGPLTLHGLRWRSPVGPVRIDIGRGLDHPDSTFTVNLNIGSDL